MTTLEHWPPEAAAATAPARPGAQDGVPSPPIEPRSFPAGTPGWVYRCTVDELLANEQPMIERIRLCFGVDAATFETQALACIRRLAAHLLNLPAPTAGAQAVPPAAPAPPAPRSLFQLAIEVAFFSLQGTDAHIFAGQATISTRRRLEPRWRLATFLAGLCSVLETVATAARVEDARQRRWHPALSPLSDWLADGAATRYQLSWRPQRHDAAGAGLLLAPHVIPAGILAHLDEDNDDILAALLASIGHLSRVQDHAPLSDLVRRAQSLVHHEHRKAAATAAASADWPFDVQQHVVEAMRHLAACDPRWAANREKSRVWRGRDGLYLIWPQAGQDILEHLESRELSGMPRSIGDLFTVLRQAGACRQGADGPTQIDTPDGASPVAVIPLSSETFLHQFEQDVPKPLESDLRRHPQAHTSTTTPKTTPPPVPAPAPDPAIGDEPEAQATSPPRPTTSFASPATTPDDASTDTRATDDTEAAVEAPGVELDLPRKLGREIAEALHAVAALAPHRKVGLLSSEGLLVPLPFFARFDVDPPLAVRHLDRVGMLVRCSDGRPRSVEHSMDGGLTRCVMLHPRFIRQLRIPGT